MTDELNQIAAYLEDLDSGSGEAKIMSAVIAENAKLREALRDALTRRIEGSGARIMSAVIAENAKLREALRDAVKLIDDIYENHGVACQGPIVEAARAALENGNE
jgi:hypothetical protein